jgi:DtxR family Mn-dependent transcriptional regulator
MYSFTEENYLKTIYHLSQQKHLENVTTNAIADLLQTKAASVTDMLKKLADKKLILYVKYQGVNLTEKGFKVAIGTVRKHRLWEVFLFDKLKFGWEEVHEVAEQLEHIQSDYLIDKLDTFLNYPSVDPHGDPIPGKDGTIKSQTLTLLIDCKKNAQVVISGVKEHSVAFLQRLNEMELCLGKKLKIHEINEFDRCMIVMIDKEAKILVSNEVAKNILVSEA